ncbi:aluminum-activated malate transporter 9 [Phtheirospermum japonicum]|uniref:Aluminum-activated malate transporter 9 n=1 Tax=Phtheirospermum japonicum TaxID=374723 RepID=A0A830CNJ8_9LAMI|nr:aluminum-activated malate transporter 9 [Phtheirospermum japonicum]
MAANLGSLRGSFLEKSKQNLFSGKYYSDVGLEDSYVIREGCLRRLFRVAGERISKGWGDVKAIVASAYEMGRSDPRKAIFGSKVGIALSVVAVLIFFREPSTYITKHSVWAILTVVLIFEFRHCKGLNRALGTLSAGALALGIAECSKLAGELQEVVIVINIFIAGFLASYLKLHPAMKQYEYGFRVFLLTFCIVLVSRTSEFVQTAISRLILIAVGAGICLIVNVCIFPIWAGEDLHKLVVKNFKGVATSLEGCVNMYLSSTEYTRIPSKILIYQAYDDPLYKGYRAALEASSQEETLLSFAVWEPPHGQYKMFNYPWGEYVKVSGALRHCAFMVMAMHGSILSEIQASPELRQVFKNEIQSVGTEGAKVLRLLGEKVEKMEKLNLPDPLLAVHDAAENLQLLIDQKSYLLVNAECWESRKRPESFADPEQLQDLRDSENKPFLIKSLSESFDQQPKQTLQNYSQKADQSLSLSQSRWGDSGEDVFKQQTMWPSRLSLSGDAILNEREVRTYESASALSLATFTSLLIEFVARLQNLINSFEQLSEKAKFGEPVDSTETRVSVGLWARTRSKCMKVTRPGQAKKNPFSRTKKLWPSENPGRAQHCQLYSQVRDKCIFHVTGEGHEICTSELSHVDYRIQEGLLILRHCVTTN